MAGFSSARLRRVVLIFLSAATLVLGFSASAPGQQRPRPRRAPIPDDAPPRPANETSCNYQEPIDYLVRENFLPRWTQPAEEQRRRRGLQADAVRFRTEQYGHFEGFGRASWNEHPPIHYAQRTEFMGLNVRLNQKILPALACVEEQIRAECADEDYTPVRLSGIRTRNTYHNGQVSNHVFGIAIDVDPQLNTCCMCVAQWGDHPLCQREVESIYERMSMPSCWVHVFERFGFYWLGRDRLQDTMHFEFLGDPNHILKTDGMPPHMSENTGAEGAAQGEGETAPQGEGETSEATDERAPGDEARSESAMHSASAMGSGSADSESAPDSESGMASEGASSERSSMQAVEETAPSEQSGGCSVLGV